MKQKYDEYFSSEGDTIAQHIEQDGDSESEESAGELSPGQFAKMAEKIAKDKDLAAAEETKQQSQEAGGTDEKGTIQESFEDFYADFQP